MFQPITITDNAGDETEVSITGDEILVQVTDQNLLNATMTSDETADYAIGSYTVEQARQLRDALDAAIQAAEGTYCLVDGDGMGWIYNTNAQRWACMGTDPEEVDWMNTTAQSLPSIYRGFDSFEAIIETFEVQS